MTKQLVLATVAILSWSATPSAQTANTLTADEKAQGSQLLFDGKTLTGWHSSAPPAPSGRFATTPATGRANAPAAPTPGQVGTPKPCTTAQGRSGAGVPAGGSHWEVVDGALS